MSLVSFVVLCAVTRGAVGTRGPTWDRSASPVTSWCTPTPSDHYEDQIHVRWDLGLQLIAQLELLATLIAIFRSV